MQHTIPRLTGLLALGLFALACQERGESAREAGATPIPPAQAASSQALDDALLLASAKIALPPEGTTATDLPDPNSRGAKLLVTYCVGCHALSPPSMHSATDWPRVVRRMWLRMDRLPERYGIRVPEVGERRVLLDYLNEHALQVSGGTLPEGMGRDAFSTVCSRCHALPDPYVHSSEDWAAVFMRMERNMERQNVSQPTREETTGILTYLQSLPSR